MPTKVGNFEVNVDRRYLIAGAGVVTLAVLGGGAYYASQRGKVELEKAAAPPPDNAQSVPMADLMEPGPLGDRAIGDPKAPVTIVEYASMTCPHCAHFSGETFPKLKERYIDTGKVRFIFREFPLDIVAAGAAMLARCAPDDKFVPLIELLFQTQNTWAVQNPLEPLFGVVKQAGFTEDTFKSCLANQDLIKGIQAERDRAVNKFGVNSTPTFFVNGKRIPGAVSIEELEKEIQPYLKVS